MGKVVRITDTDFWSKVELPHVNIENDDGTTTQAFTTLWVSLFDRGEEVIHIPPKKAKKLEFVGLRIAYEMKTRLNTPFCRVSDDPRADYSELNDGILSYVKDRTNNITDILLETDGKGNYMGFTFIVEKKDRKNNNVWYIPYLCTKEGTSGVGKTITEKIKKCADRSLSTNHPIQYVFLETIKSAREFYKKQGFVHVVHRKDEPIAECLIGIPEPVIDTPHYNYDKEDLMVYCPKGKSKPVNFKPGDRVIVKNVNKELNGKLVVIENIIGELVTIKYKGTSYKVGVNHIEKIVSKDFKTNQRVMFTFVGQGSSQPNVTEEEEGIITGYDETNNEYAIRSIVDEKMHLVKPDHIRPLSNEGGTRRKKKNRTSTRRK